MQKINYFLGLWACAVVLVASLSANGAVHPGKDNDSRFDSDNKELGKDSDSRFDSDNSKDNDGNRISVNVNIFITSPEILEPLLAKFLNDPTLVRKKSPTS